MSANGERRERGSALLVAVLMLVFMGAIGFAALDTVTRDRQVAGFQSRERMAFYAAEAGLSEALGNLESTGTPTVTDNTPVGDATSFPYGQPSYQRDPTAAPDPPIDDLGGTGLPGYDLVIDTDAAPTFQLHNWRVRVQGQEVAGSTARIEMVAGRLEGS